MNERGDADAVDVSFVIPAYNEEKFIAATVASIHRSATGLVSEIILVDNGSTDRTRALAADNGARVLEQQGGTIGRLRNHGASEARGRVLVFLDADVTLASSWRAAFDSVQEEIAGSPTVLAGSSCSVPADAGWIERVWFAPRSDDAASHIGSAHLIVDRRRFLDCGGFDETLETGEDYELCTRIVRGGGVLHRLPRSVVEHHGFPKTLGQFFRREVWHGTSDYVSAAAIRRSPVAIASLLFGALHLLAIVALIAGASIIAIAALTGVVLICSAASMRAFGHAGVPQVIRGSAMYYVYFAARIMSFARARSARGGSPRVRETTSLMTAA